ncbi:MAG: autotransporter domain-containing protein [Deltaproteobacteria bacterium]|jgi:outer membrane autotransporter protein|nr:autotransporter domain-containing protein [Deltaproteobacteria bacterium]
MNSVGRKWADFAHGLLNIVPQLSVIAIIAVLMAFLGCNLALAQYAPYPTITPFINTYDPADVPSETAVRPGGSGYLNLPVGSDTDDTVVSVLDDTFFVTPKPTDNIMVVTGSDDYNYVGGGSTDTTVVTGNQVWINGATIGTPNQVRVIGGASETSAITGNAVIMVAGSVDGSIAGGGNQNSTNSDGAGMTVSGNKVVIFDGTVGTVNGGVTHTSVTNVCAGTRCGATTQDNEVWIKDGTFNGAVRGGSASQGDARGNKVYVNGGNFTAAGSIAGGHISGAESTALLQDLTVYGNYVEIYGGADGTAISGLNTSSSVEGGVIEKAIGGTIEQNRVLVYNADVNFVYGGVLEESGDTLRNSATIKSNVVTIYGNATYKPTVARAAGGIIEGYYVNPSDDYMYSSGTIQDNTLTVWNANISTSASGGISEGFTRDTKVERNTLTIGGGSVAGTVYGGAHILENTSPSGGNDDGYVQNNFLYLAGVTVFGNAYGGQAVIGDTTGNKVYFVSGDNTISGNVYGGFADTAAKVGNNLIEFQGGVNTVNGDVIVSSGDLIGTSYGDLKFTGYGSTNRINGNISGAGLLEISNGVNYLGDVTTDVIDVGSFAITTPYYYSGQNYVKSAVTVASSFLVDGGTTNAFDGDITVSDPAGAFTVSNNYGVNTFSGDITVNGATADFTLSGNSSNTFSGTTNVNGADASFTLSGSGVGVITFNGATNVNGANASFTVSGSGANIFTGATNVNGANASFTVSGGTTNTFTGPTSVIGGNGTFEVSGGVHNTFGAITMNASGGIFEILSGDDNKFTGAIALGSDAKFLGHSQNVLSANLSTPSHDVIIDEESRLAIGAALTVTAANVRVTTDSILAPLANDLVIAGSLNLANNSILQISEVAGSEGSIAANAINIAPGDRVILELDGTFGSATPLLTSATTTLNINQFFSNYDLSADGSGNIAVTGGRLPLGQSLLNNAARLSVAETPNYASAAKALDMIDASAATPAALELSNALGLFATRDMPLSSNPELALKQLIGESLVNVVAAVSQTTLKAQGLVYGRLDRVREIEGVTPPAAGAYAPSAGDNAELRRVWLGGFGTWTDVSDRDHVLGYDYKATGFALGYDRIVDAVPGLRMGFSAAFSFGKLDTNDRSTKVDIDTSGLGVYASYLTPVGVFVDGSVSYSRARNDYDTTFIYGSRKSGGFNINSWQIGARVGTTLKANNFQFIPSVGVRFVAIDQEGWTEEINDPNLAALINRFDAHRDNQVDIPIQLKINATIERGSLRFTPELRLGWTISAKRADDSLRVGFPGSPERFDISGVKPVRNAFSAGLGFKLVTGIGADVFLNYDYEGASGFKNHQVGVGIGYEF